VLLFRPKSPRQSARRKSLLDLGHRQGDAEQGRLEPLDWISAKVSCRDIRFGMRFMTGVLINKPLLDSSEG
jgi:hypothetical protein